MLRTLPARLQNERGFALAELLVAIIVIGILAAIALPAFLSQQLKGHDADAKSNARNAVSAVESCFVERRQFSGCDTVADLEATGSKLAVPLTTPTAPEPGAVSVSATATTYTIVGYSKSENRFSISKKADGTYSRSCTAGGTGGCQTGDAW